MSCPKVDQFWSGISARHKIKINYLVNNYKGKGKIHGSAVFKCKSEEEKIIELKRKSSNAVSARLYRKRYGCHFHLNFTIKSISYGMENMGRYHMGCHKLWSNMICGTISYVIRYDMRSLMIWSRIILLHLKLTHTIWSHMIHTIWSHMYEQYKK